MSRLDSCNCPIAASEAAAAGLAAALERRLAQDTTASLVVSGGSSPIACLEILSRVPLDWSRVHVTVTDEREVPLTDPRRNEKMVRERLLQGPARVASFHPLEAGRPPPIPTPFAAVLIGMGEDGHFASLFPGLAMLDELLNVDAPHAVHRVNPAVSDASRLTLNLSALIDSDAVILLAVGGEKRAIIESPAGYPVDALLTQTRMPVAVVWSPSKE